MSPQDDSADHYRHLAELSEQLNTAAASYDRTDTEAGSAIDGVSPDLVDRMGPQPLGRNSTACAMQEIDCRKPDNELTFTFRRRDSRAATSRQIETADAVVAMTAQQCVRGFQARQDRRLDAAGVQT